MAGQKIDIKATLLRLKMWITHNWPWKLLSLFLAICLWSGLITQDESLTREKVFNDVTINIVNADTLRRNGFIIVSGLENLPTVRFRADVPQKVYNIASASNYNYRADCIRHARGKHFVSYPYKMPLQTKKDTQDKESKRGYIRLQIYWT